MGNGKLSDKQIRNFGVREESFVESSLGKLDLTVSDIDMIIMTHLHFDHACGLTKWENDTYVSIFKEIPIYRSAVEWNEMRDPKDRKSTRLNSSHVAIS